MLTESEKSVVQIAIVSSIENVQVVITNYRHNKIESVALTIAEEQLLLLKSAC